MSPALLVLLVAISIGIIVANAMASRRIAADELSNPAQKTAQHLFVWLVPVIGAAIAFILNKPALPSGAGHYPAEPEEEEDPEVAQIDYGSSNAWGDNSELSGLEDGG